MVKAELPCPILIAMVTMIFNCKHVFCNMAIKIHFYEENVTKHFSSNFHYKISAVMSDIIIRLVTEHFGKICKYTFIVCPFLNRLSDIM